jgi:hypothetical protein
MWRDRDKRANPGLDQQKSVVTPFLFPKDKDTSRRGPVQGIGGLCSGRIGASLHYAMRHNSQPFAQREGRSRLDRRVLMPRVVHQIEDKHARASNAVARGPLDERDTFVQFSPDAFTINRRFARLTRLDDDMGHVLVRSGEAGRGLASALFGGQERHLSRDTWNWR